jgi:CheY-like chemotaxis protein
MSTEKQISSRMESKILIVDDERTVLKQVKILLDNFGYKCAFIPRAQILLNRLEHESFDLILLDINMPGIDGITALKLLKKHSVHKDIPVIMMTGDTSDETLETCFTHGAADYITKPIGELILKARVKSVIEKQEYIKRIQFQMNEIQTQQEKLIVQKQLLERKNKDITQSIDYAKNIQEAMLPTMEEIKSALHDFFILYKPKDVISGDFYWFTEVDGKIIIAAVDCTGHSVPGAFMSMLGDSNINHIVNIYKITEPDKILNKLDFYIRQALKQNETNNTDGMDISICTIDKENRILEFAGAYHRLIYIQNEQLHEIKGERYGIGGKQLDEGKLFTKHTIPFENDTIFYIFSDGYADQIGGPEDRKFMVKRFRQLLFHIHKQPLVEQHKILEETVEKWKGREKQIDDILVMGFKVSEEEKHYVSKKKYDWKNKVILIAEDIEFNFIILKNSLEETQANILWAKNGKEAVEMCKFYDSIDIVLMDVYMPVMDGFTAITEIRKDKQDLPVIVLTAFAESDEKLKSFEVGCSDYIAKPINTKELLATIDIYI